jgi:hypothetical protein
MQRDSEVYFAAELRILEAVGELMSIRESIPRHALVSCHSRNNHLIAEIAVPDRQFARP